MRHGAMVSRVTEKDGRAFAFSRFDPETANEYLVAVNTGAEPRTVNVGIDHLSRRFEALMGHCPVVEAPGAVTLELAPFAVLVSRADQASSRAGR